MLKRSFWFSYSSHNSFLKTWLVIFQFRWINILKYSTQIIFSLASIYDDPESLIRPQPPFWCHFNLFIIIIAVFMLFSQPLLRIHLILLSLHATLSPACESLRPRRMNDSFSSTRPRVPSEGLNEILHPSPNSSSAADRKDNEPNQKDPLCERGPVFFGWAFSTISTDLKLPTQLMGRNLAYFYIVNDPSPECLLTFLLVFQLSSLRGN